MPQHRPCRSPLGIIDMRIILILAALLLGLASADAANRFLVCTVTCTITAADTSIWSTTTGGGTGASVPGSSDAVILDAATCVGGVTCTATMGAAYNPTWQSLTMGACTAATAGCILDFSVNNNNLTLNQSAGFSGTGTGTRTLNMGNGTWTLQSATGIFTLATTTGLTFNANASIISFTGSGTGQRTFAGGALTYSTVSFASGGLGTIAMSGSNAIGTLNLASGNWLLLTAGTTQTITNAFTWTGTAAAPITVSSSNIISTAIITITSGSPSMSWAVLSSIVFSGGATFTATNSLNLGRNTGITITPPSGGSGTIIGGWLLNRDLDAANDNAPVGLEAVA